jgi:hypothetical protein
MVLALVAQQILSSPSSARTPRARRRFLLVSKGTTRPPLDATRAVFIAMTNPGCASGSQLPDKLRRSSAPSRRRRPTMRSSARSRSLRDWL